MSSEALRLADWLDQNSSGIYRPAAQAASLLRTYASLEAERDQLRAEVERLRTAMTVPAIESNSQNWRGMDGAIAFHLIERHADNWADAGKMMREWLDANRAIEAAKEA